MPEHEHDDITVLADQIEHYLAVHPNAADSSDGIARWWVARQRYQETTLIVQKALDYLQKKGVVSKSLMRDGVVIYRGSKNRLCDD